MIKIEITDPSNTDVNELKALGRFLFDLAGEPLNTFTAGDVSMTVNNHGEVLRADLDQPFNAHELAESEAIAKENKAAHAERNPDPKAVFAHSTAAAAPSSTAPVAALATSTVPSATLPPAPPAVPPVTTAAPTTASPAHGVELDSNGLPWDSRIHSSSREKIRDGSWKKRRGVDDALVAQVEVELRGIPSVTVQAAPAPAPIVPTAPIVPPPAAPAPLTQPPAIPTAPAAISFPLLMPKITAALGNGSLTQTRVMEVLQANGLASIPMLATRADLVPVVDAALFGAA